MRVYRGNITVRRAHAVVRSMILGMSTLAIIGVLFAVYQYSTGVNEVEDSDVRQPTFDPPALATAPPQAGAVMIDERPLGEGGKFVIVQYEPGSDRARLELESTGWRPTGDRDGEFQQIEVDQPDIRMLTPNGQRIRVRADAGLLYVIRSGQNSMDPRRGELVGNVQMDVDRMPEAERLKLPEDERDAEPDESRMIRLRFESVSFDVDASRLETDGAFTLRMAEAGAEGSGLRLTYNEVDRRVEHFEIVEGGSVWVRGADTLFVRVLPGDRSTGDGHLPPAPVGNEVAADEPIEQAVVDQEAPDTYVAEIEDDVTILKFEGGENIQRLSADLVRVLFDFGRQQREQMRTGRSTANTTDGTAAAAADERTEPASSEDRVTLTWSGRLTVRPQQQETPSEPLDPDVQRFRMVATGSEVLLADRLGKVTCRKIEVHSETNDVWISGLGDRVVFSHEEHGTLVGGDMFIDRESGVARMSGPARWVGSVASATGEGASESTDVIDVRFEESAAMVIGSYVERIVHPVSGEAREKTRSYIETATLTGDVVLKRGGDLIAGDTVTLAFDEPQRASAPPMDLTALDANGSVLLVSGDDRVTCNDLRMTFSRGADGRPVPRTATVRENVVITQGELLVTATDYVMLEMASVSRRSAANDDASSDDRVDSGYTVGIEWLAAEGAVTVSDPSRGLDLSAESLVAEFASGEISVVRVTGPDGGMAFVASDDYSIRAHRIDADVTGSNADVFGSGEVRLIARRGLDGTEFDTPMPIEVSWSEAMSFRGNRNTARFLGDVHAVSRRQSASTTTNALPQMETVTVDAQELVIDLADVEPESEQVGPAPRSVGTPLIDDDGEGDETAGPRFSKEPVYIVASRGVVAVFTTVDALLGRVTNRARFESDKLTVDLRAELLNVPQAGSLLIENYGPDGEPAAEKTDEASLFGTDEPSQTYISWAGSLSYHQGRHRADFRERVHLDHRRGREMVLSKDHLASHGFQADADPDLGRRTQLDCTSLVVEFAGEDHSDSRASIGSMSIEELRQLEASGGVLLVDDYFTVNAYRIVKYEDSELLRIYGTPARHAEIYGRDGDATQFQALEFAYDLETGRIDAVTPQVRGRRRDHAPR